MRIEYIVVGFVIVLIVLGVSLAMLSGILPSFATIFNLTMGR
jgi:hypothetical protein